MAALIVQSRFAGLNIEDDDYPPTRDAQKKKKTSPAPPAAKKTDPKKKNTTGKTQTSQKKKKPKTASQTSEQWEQWKQKDEELVDGNFEDELHQAILLSKLDFEQKKDLYKQLKKESELEKKTQEQAAKNNNKKQKKKNVMSLDQFNDLVTGSSGSEPNRLQENEIDSEEQNTPSKDTEFFERIKHETKSELLKDKIIDRVKNRLVASDEVISRGQFADALEKKDIEIETLKEEVKSLKEELLTVKSRNKKLCNILGQGEMRDKAQVLVEVEKLRGVQAELTAEVQALHTELEKERSRNADARTKDKKKKAVSSEKEK